MAKTKKYFKIAAYIAKKESTDCFRRDYLLGAIGIRTDGTLVFSRNLPANDKTPEAHAESRVTRKLNVGSVIYVCRINRQGDFCNSRPCPHCENTMKQRGIEKCFYTISQNEFGVIKF